eukprot:1137040-Prorocentrum_lima.AAC.1
MPRSSMSTQHQLSLSDAPFDNLGSATPGQTSAASSSQGAQRGLSLSNTPFDIWELTAPGHSQ